MKILITGGAGFIGSNLVRRYTNQENEIVIIDNLCTGKMSNIEDIVKQKNVKFLKKDICDVKTVDFIKKSKFDYIYNFACPASPKYYLKFPIETWEASVLGVRNILKAIKGTSTRLLQASTSDVYGSAKEIPQKESYWGNVNCYGVRACYDEGKRSAETLIFDYKRLFNVDARIVRIFNTYGQGMDKNDGRVIANFMNQAINNEDITVYGDGNQTRSFCYIEDTIDAIIKVMNKKENVETPINIGNPVEVTIKEIANIKKNITGSKSNIKFCEANKDDPPRRKPDINKAINEIGWKPKVELEYGLKKCLEYYIDQNKSI